jgi:hypothetical protein
MLPSAVHAQLDCASAVTIARDLISSAQTALDQSDPTVAANLMEQQLYNCARVTAANVPPLSPLSKPLR